MAETVKCKCRKGCSNPASEYLGDLCDPCEGEGCDVSVVVTDGHCTPEAATLRAENERLREEVRRSEEWAASIDKAQAIQQAEIEQLKRRIEQQNAELERRREVISRQQTRGDLLASQVVRYAKALRRLGVTVPGDTPEGKK